MPFLAAPVLVIGGQTIATVGSLLTTAASIAYQVNRANSIKKKQRAAAEARKGFEITRVDTTENVPVLYGRVKVGPVVTDYNVASNFTYAAPTGYDAADYSPSVDTFNYDANHYIELSVVGTTGSDLTEPGETGQDIINITEITTKVYWDSSWEYLNTKDDTDLPAGTYLAPRFSTLRNELGNLKSGNYRYYPGPATRIDNSTYRFEVRRVELNPALTVFNRNLTANKTGSRNEYMNMQGVLGFAGIEEVVDLDFDAVNQSDDRYDPGFAINIYPNGSVEDPMSTANGFPSTNTFTEMVGVGASFKLNRDDPQFRDIPTQQYYILGQKVHTVTSGGALSASKVFTTNAANILLDYLMSDTYGRGLSTDQLDLDSFYAAQEVCGTVVRSDAVVGGKVYGGAGVADILLYEFNGVIDTSNTIRDNIDIILESMGQASLVWSGGKYKLQVTYPTAQPSVGNGYVDANHVFTDENIVRDEINLTWTNAQDKYNQITVRFPNAFKDFKEDSVTWPKTGSTVHNQYLSDDNQQVLHTELSPEGIIDPYHAAAKAEEMVRLSRTTHTIQVTLTKHAMTLEPGDYFILSSEAAQLTNEVYRVESVTVTPELSVKIEAYAFNYETLAWNVDDDVAYGDSLRFSSVLLPPADVTYTPTIGNFLSSSSGVLSWTASLSGVVVRYKLEMTNDSGTTWDSLGETTSTRFDLPPLTDGTYQFRVSATTILGRTSEWVLAEHFDTSETEFDLVATVPKRASPIYGDSPDWETNAQSLTPADGYDWIAFWENTLGEVVLGTEGGKAALVDELGDRIELNFSRYVGSDSPMIRLYSEGALFFYDANGDMRDPAKFHVLTADIKGVDRSGTRFAAPTLTWTSDETMSWAPSGDTITVNATDFDNACVAAGVDKITVTAELDYSAEGLYYDPLADPADFVITDSFTFYQIKESGGLTALLTNEAHTLPATDAGVVSSYTGSNTAVKMFYGSDLMNYDGVGTSDGTWRIDSVDVYPAPGDITLGTLTAAGDPGEQFASYAEHSGMASDEDLVYINYNLAGVTPLGVSFSGFTKTQTITKSKSGSEGASGIDPIQVVIENSAHTAPADNDGTNTDLTDSGSIIRVYEGGTELTYDSTPVAGQWEVTSSSVSPVGAISVGTVSDSGTYGIIADHSSMSNSENVCVITYTIQGKYTDGTDFTRYATQTITKAREGVAGTSGDDAITASYYALTSQTITKDVDAGTYDATYLDIVFEFWKAGSKIGQERFRITRSGDTWSTTLSDPTYSGDLNTSRISAVATVDGQGATIKATYSYGADYCVISAPVQVQLNNFKGDLGDPGADAISPSYFAVTSQTINKDPDTGVYDASYLDVVFQFEEAGVLVGSERFRITRSGDTWSTSLSDPSHVDDLNTTRISAVATVNSQTAVIKATYSYGGKTSTISAPVAILIGGEKGDQGDPGEDAITVSHKPDYSSSYTITKNAAGTYSANDLYIQFIFTKNGTDVARDTCRVQRSGDSFSSTVLDQSGTSELNAGDVSFAIVVDGQSAVVTATYDNGTETAYASAPVLLSIDGETGAPGSPSPRYAKVTIWIEDSSTPATTLLGPTITWSTGAIGGDLTNTAGTWTTTAPTIDAVSSDDWYSAEVIFYDPTGEESVTTGTVGSASKAINFNGIVTFTNVSGTTTLNDALDDASTVINGARITTGTLDADKITTGTLDVNSVTISGDISATHITGGTLDINGVTVSGTLSASHISGGTLNFDNATIAGTLSTDRLDIDGITLSNNSGTLEIGDGGVDLSKLTVEDTTNLVDNPNFAYGDVRGWNSDVGAAPVYSTTKSYTGSGSMLLTGSTTYRVTNNMVADVRGGDGMRIRGFVYYDTVVNDTCTLFLEARIYQSNGTTYYASEVAQLTLDTSNDDGWVELDQLVVLPEHANTGKVKFAIVISGANSSNKFYFDELSLTRVPSKLNLPPEQFSFYEDGEQSGTMSLSTSWQTVATLNFNKQKPNVVPCFWKLYVQDTDASRIQEFEIKFQYSSNGSSYSDKGTIQQIDMNRDYFYCSGVRLILSSEFPTGEGYWRMQARLLSSPSGTPELSSGLLMIDGVDGADMP